MSSKLWLAKLRQPKALVVGLLCVVLTNLTLAPSVSAQPEVVWSERYGDQGFDLNWHQTLIKDEETGDLIFLREHPSEDGITRNYLTRVTEDGNLVWSHLVPGGGSSFNIPALIKTSEGLYAMVGGSPIIGVDCEFLFLIMDEHGNLITLSVFENGPASHGNTLIETEDGGFALAGYFGSQVGIGLDWDFWLIRTNNIGQLMWSRHYGTPDENQTCQAICQTLEGGFLLAGTGDEDVMLKKVDANGELFWSKRFGGPGSDECNGLIKANGENYFLIGSYENDRRDTDGYIVSIDSEGNLLWSQVLGGMLSDKFGGALITSDRALALVGTTQSGIDPDGDIWLVKVGQLGDIGWETTFGGDDSEEGNGIVQLSDGSFALSGNTSSFGAQFGDVWLIKTGPDPDIASRFVVKLDEGWSFVSSAVKPSNPEMEEIWLNQHRFIPVEMVKDQFGRFFIPVHGFNGIPEWDFRQGYLVYMTAADSLVFTNIPSDPTTKIPIHNGWNLVSYFPQADLPAQVAFESIAQNIEIVKDDQGRFYEPAANFSNMGQLKRGEGYNVKFMLSGEFSWNIPLQDQQSNPMADIQADPTHFKAHHTSYSNMSLLIDSRSNNSDVRELVAVSPYGQHVGACTVNASGLSGMAIWGDDPLTVSVEGATEGASLRYIAWDGVEEFDVSLITTLGDGLYHTDGYQRAMLEVDASLPESFGIKSLFPNPFNSELAIDLELNQMGLVKVAVYDVNGREVAVLADRVIEAGREHVSWNATNQATGIYVVKIESLGRVVVEKVVLER